MSNRDENLRHRGLSPKVVASFVFFVGCILAAGVLCTLAWVNRSRTITITAAHNPSPPAISVGPPEKSDRDTALAMIPAEGSFGQAQMGRNLPEEVVNAAAAVAVPMADPVALSEASQPADPKLADWLKTWRDGGAMTENANEAVRVQLSQSLNDSPLTSDSLFKIGQAASQVSSDSPTASVFILAAVKRADKQLQSMAAGSDEAKPILITMNNARRTLWDASDFHGRDRMAMDALDIINRDLVKWVNPSDPDLADARRHGLLGVAEDLFVKGDVAGSLPLLMDLDTKGMTANELIGVAWIRGLALDCAHRDAEAEAQFQVVASHVSYQFAESAAKLTVVTLVASGRKDAANEAFDHWMRLYKPKDEVALPVVAALFDQSGLSSH